MDTRDARKSDDDGGVRPAGTSTRDERRSNEGRALGAQGEARAARFLVRRGYRIAARNVRVGGVEIDLIATRGPVVAFVEVKTRRSERLGRPELAVDHRKRARMIRAAAAWLQQNRGNLRRVRFDVIACRSPHGTRRGWQIEHLPGAFDAGD